LVALLNKDSFLIYRSPLL